MKINKINRFCLALLFGLTSLTMGCKKGENVEMDTINHVGYQLNMPSEGEEIANINTNFGSFKIRFFPDAAPKAVENFKTLSRNGYYNGIRFHRIIEDFMIQGGDPEGSGRGGESIWGESFEDEFSSNLLNITGALAMANSGPNTNGSQFFINHQNPESFHGWDNLNRAYEVYLKNPELFSARYGSTVDMSKVTDEVKNLYERYGGNIHLDGYYNTQGRGHTVFGQVFEGLDVVENISKVETDENDKPLKDVKIEYISIENYST